MSDACVLDGGVAGCGGSKNANGNPGFLAGGGADDFARAMPPADHGAVVGAVVGAENGMAAASPAGLTREAAAAALAAVRGDLAVIRKRAEAAHRAARHGEAGAIVALDRDFMTVRQGAERRGPYDSPDPVGIALLWLEAEARWLAYDAKGVPQALRVAALAPSRTLAPASPEDGARRLIAALAGRGIALHVTAEGRLAAGPAGMLNEADRALLDRHRPALMALLSMVEFV